MALSVAVGKWKSAGRGRSRGRSRANKRNISREKTKWRSAVPKGQLGVQMEATNFVVGLQKRRNVRAKMQINGKEMIPIVITQMCCILWEI